MTVHKPISVGLCLVLVAAGWAPPSAAQARRRTSVGASSRSRGLDQPGIQRCIPRWINGAFDTGERRLLGVSLSGQAVRPPCTRAPTPTAASWSTDRTATTTTAMVNYHDDDDAWKWLAFTAITLKVLDNLNEEQQRQHEAAQVEATTAPVGQPITWDDGNASGSVTTTRQGQDAAGNQCREFQQEVSIAGQAEQAYGTACLQPDGSWKIQE